MNICLTTHATICLIDVQMARAIGKGSSKARRKQASGDFATICLPSRLSRTFIPSSTPHCLCNHPQQSFQLRAKRENRRSHIGSPVTAWYTGDCMAALIGILREEEQQALKHHA